MKLKRVYFPYHEWEEYKLGMWRIVRGKQRQDYAEAAADLMRDVDSFKENMRRVIKEWPVSCLANFTAPGNHIAWLGHAGCLLGVNSPEENTRIGWHMLKPQEQAEANRVAAEVLQEWHDGEDKKWH
jgi:hypothetical protein